MAALLLALALVPAAPATTVNGLYTASTPVPGQSPDARAQAFGRDLVAVFVKASGNPNAGQVAALQSAIENAGRFVLEFRYKSAPDANGRPGPVLWARFDPKAVDDALAQAQQGIWGRDRPNVVAWVLSPSGIVSDDPANPVAAAMRGAARTRGLPLVIPLMDLADQKLVSNFDVRTAFLPALQSASGRYGAQALLVGTIRYADAGATSDWTLAFGDTNVPFSITAASPQAAGGEGVNRAATLLAERLAYHPQSGAAGVILLVVDGVDSLSAEVGVERTAAAVQGVSGVTLAGVSGGVTTYRVRYSGVPSDFARALSLAGSLTQTSGPARPAPTSTSVAATSVPAATVYFHYGQ